ncbi:MAG: IS3 family transposase [Candidatus Dormibacteria bacterium]
MGRRPFKTPDEKLQIILSVLRGEATQVDLGRRLELSQTTISKWQKQFLEGGRESLARGDNPRPSATSRREADLEAQVEELTAALGEAYVEHFCARLGIPRSTWYYWRHAHTSNRPVRHWPAPVVDRIEPAAAATAEKYSAWGHRKIWAMLQVDGIDVSPASVKRAMARRGLLLPRRYQAERRQLAKARRAVFEAPPSRRNRIWQTDFSEFETIAGGTWQLSGIVDYVAKVCLACPPSGTKTAIDAVASLEAAIATAEALLGIPPEQDCIDPMTGETAPLVIVTDNGPAYRSALFARFIAAHLYLVHVRTRYRSPQTNGVIERFFGSIKYEHLYREEIQSGAQLADEIGLYLPLYNTVRPHEGIGFRRPLDVYLADPATLPEPVTGHTGSRVPRLLGRTQPHAIAESVVTGASEDPTDDL